MHYGYSDNKAALGKRLNRAEGQIRGIRRMVEADVYCIDILTQVTAAKAALDKVALELLRDHARHCLANDSVLPGGRKQTNDASDQDRTTDKADELINAISRML